MEGWIRLYRASIEHPIVCKDAEHYAIWSYLLLHAAYTPTAAWFNGNRVELQPGQLITGRRAIAQNLNISPSKVFRVLNLFKIEQQIEQRTSNLNSLLTIVNWQKYQSNEPPCEPQPNHDRTTTEPQLNTIIRKKEVKKEKITTREEPPDFSQFKAWIAENAPSVGRMREPFTLGEFRRIKEEFSRAQIQQTLRVMHNWKPLLMKNLNANITFRRWVEKERIQPPGAKLQPGDEDARQKLLNRLL